MTVERLHWLHRARLGSLRFVFRNSYSRYYRHFMEVRAKQDPKAAVGGMWDEIGQLQFDTLCSFGLQPSHRLLDIGCGALRGGEKFIGYLDPGNYTGIDISEHILEAGKELLPPGLLSARRPRLLQNSNLRFSEFLDHEFDFALAQSVFTHMPRDGIEECLTHLPRVLADDGRFFFTVFFDERERYDPKMENFYYPKGEIEQMCICHGWLPSFVEEFRHPRSQKLYIARRESRGN